jgi:hypothetical protein
MTASTIRDAVKRAIRDKAHGDQGAPVDDVVSSGVGAYSERETVEVFDDMKRRGDVYVIPGDDADRVKITER